MKNREWESIGLFLLVYRVLIRWEVIWFGIFSVIYYFSWKCASWKRGPKMALAVLLISTAILVPFHFWGTYNLAGIGNDGLFLCSIGDGGTSISLPPEATYKSETLSNLFTIGRASVIISTNGEVIFYVLDENIPDVRYEEHNSSPPSDSFTFGLSYYYSDLYVVANWTMNVHNPSPNTTVDLSIDLRGWEDDERGADQWGSQYLMYREPTRILLSLWMVAVITTPIFLPLLLLLCYRKSRLDKSNSE